MNLDDFGRVADAALASIELLLGDWFPNGVKQGREFCIGSRSGETGKSMRICLSGAKAGYWSDFSSDGEAGRDLISLYAHVEGISQGKACAHIAQQLGIALSDSTSQAVSLEKSSKPPRAPALPGVKESKARTQWVPVLPVPDDAGIHPVAHPIRGRAQSQWKYCDQQGRLLGVISRFVTSDGGKEVLPCVYARHSVTGKSEWRWLAFPEPRPLYLTAPLRDGIPVLVVEGEKCADAAYRMIASVYDVVSWPGGGKAVQKADWTPLSGRRVILWADADAKVYKEGHIRAGQVMDEAEQPGMRAMETVHEQLSGRGCDIQFVDIPAPGVMADGYDVADLIDIDGADTDKVLAWCANVRQLPITYPPLTLVVDNAPDPVVDDGVPAWVAAPPDTSTPVSAGAEQKDKRILRSMFIRTTNNGVKGCRENVYMALEHDPRLRGLVALDLFSQLQMKRRATPWPSEPGEWSEGDDFHLGMYLANEYGLVMASVGEIEKAVAQAARQHAFNPVTDYMKECAIGWDGVKRVEMAFSRYWGATDSEYLRLISSMFFVGLAKRAFFPGVKHDHAPVFEGGQGGGKSTSLAVLGGDWFADTPFRMGDKDGYLSIQGILIYEVAELEQFNRSETTAIKAFMSSKMDRYREPYGRRMKNKPRTAVFCGTTNEGEYFKDTTGNRRFWPVETGHIDLDALRADRDQIIGEAVHMMRGNARWFPTPEEQYRLINDEQEKREIADPWLGRIYDYIEGKDSDGRLTLGRLARVTVRELLTQSLHIEIGKLGPAKQETMRIAACMRKLGWVKGRETEGARERYYTRPAPDIDVAMEREDDVPIPF